MSKQHEPLDANKLLIGLVDLIAHGSALATQFDRLSQDLRIPEGATKIVFLSGIKKILRELPEKAFIDKNSRLAMIDAVQDALDAAIDLEEDMAIDKQKEGE